MSILASNVTIDKLNFLLMPILSSNVKIDKLNFLLMSILDLEEMKTQEHGVPLATFFSNWSFSICQ